MNDQSYRASFGLPYLISAFANAAFKTFVFPFVFLVLLSIPDQLHAQAVTGIITDYKGFWKSSVATPNTNKPTNNHNLLAFTYNGTQYSTGVNDELLYKKGEVYTAADFWCLPVGAITGKADGQTKVGVGALFDGVSNGGSNPPPENDMRRYLTDGIKGLNIGTCIANLPKGALHFFVHSINASEIGDGKPDIVVTQVADPSGNSFDRYEFTDENGNRVGNYKDIVFTSINPVGSWLGDFYEASKSPMELVSPFIQTTRPIRLWAADLSEFGLNSTNISQIRNFKINLSGISDVAFVAYNKNGMGIGVLPVSLLSFKAAANTNSVQLQWQTGTEKENNRFVIERSSDGIHFTAIGTVPGNGNSAGSYRFTDAQPLTGTSYYRLKQVDNNGAFTYSQVVPVKRSPAAQVQVYPNPGQGVFVISHPPSAAAQKLLLYNAYGALLGYKMTTPNAQQTTIDLSYLPNGAYYFTFYSNGALSSAQFSVRH
jgi:hypothetical protein